MTTILMIVMKTVTGWGRTFHRQQSGYQWLLPDRIDKAVQESMQSFH
jgi:hypothetical protein